MKYYAKARNEFTAYMKAVIRHSATDYKRKVIKSIEREISVADFTSVPELLSYDDSSFLLAEEKGITYASIEKLFENDNYYRAMKRLSDREKLVLFLMVVEEKRAGQAAEIMNTTKDNIWQIKSRAIKHFLRNVSEK